MCKLLTDSVCDLLFLCRVKSEVEFLSLTLIPSHRGQSVSCVEKKKRGEDRKKLLRGRKWRKGRGKKKGKETRKDKLQSCHQSKGQGKEMEWDMESSLKCDWTLEKCQSAWGVTRLNKWHFGFCWEMWHSHYHKYQFFICESLMSHSHLLLCCPTHVSTDGETVVCWSDLSNSTWGALMRQSRKDGRKMSRPGCRQDQFVLSTC